MPEPKLPRGSVKFAADALVKAGLLNNAGYMPGDEQEAARVALTAAWPAIEKAVQREMARRILLLDALARGNACPLCHREPLSEGLGSRAGSVYFRHCRCGAEWKSGPSVRVEWQQTADALLRAVARGKPLPDLPPKEDDGD